VETAERSGVLERVVFFSDAVFAIAITLLIFDVRAPILVALNPDSSLLDQLGTMSGQLFAFVVGFLVIGSYWSSHLRVFRVVVRIDLALIWINLGFLFWIVAMPFVTATLGDNPLSRATVVLFAAVQVAAGLFQVLMWRYVVRHPVLVSEPLPALVARNVMFQLLEAPIVFFASILVTIVAGPVVGAWTWVGIAVLRGLMARVYPIPATPL